MQQLKKCKATSAETNIIFGGLARRRAKILKYLD
jgi:hypothetical protein